VLISLVLLVGILSQSYTTSLAASVKVMRRFSTQSLQDSWFYVCGEKVHHEAREATGEGKWFTDANKHTVTIPSFATVNAKQNKITKIICRRRL